MGGIVKDEANKYTDTRHYLGIPFAACRLPAGDAMGDAGKHEGHVT